MRSEEVYLIFVCENERDLREIKILTKNQEPRAKNQEPRNKTRTRNEGRLFLPSRFLNLRKLWKNIPELTSGLTDSFSFF